MKTKKIKYYLYIIFLGFISYSCVDNVPEVETLPSADVSFTYIVTDATYQLDYYVGSTIQFTSTSYAKGTCVWDFGDGSEKATGDVVTHKFSEAGTFTVKLTVADTKSASKPIMISDITPIMTIDSIEGGICEVQKTPISISVELPNPEKLSEEYHWTFPDGTMNENGEIITTSTEKNPGKIKFSNVGSQTVKLDVKLGGRLLEEGSVNVQVAYNEAVPTLYFAVKGGNIMALKLANDAPINMVISPFDLAVSSGKHPLNILYADSSLYVLDCGQQFTYVNDEDGNLGDGKITVISKDGSKVETMISNIGQTAFDDPYYGYIEGKYLYFSDRNTGISKIKLTDRNKIYSKSDFPYYVQNATLGYYNNGWSYGSMNACFGKINNVWYWCKTYNGTGLFRFTDADILSEATTGGEPAPSSGITLSGMSPKSFVWDSKNQVIYFTVYDTGYEGLYRCTLDQLNAIGSSKSSLSPYKLLTANGKTVTPITTTGEGEGSTGEFIGISQLALDQSTGCVYFGLRSAYPNEVKSGLMRYNPAKGYIEPVIPGVEVYGVAVNNNKSKLF